MKKNPNFFKKNILLYSYVFLFLLYAVFSYVLTDPNLILLKAEPFVKFQTFMWQNILPKTDLRCFLFLGLSTLLFLNYFLIIKKQKKLIIKQEKNLLIYLLILATILLFTYNALSYDIFNYIFNAHMLVDFQANPHIKVALDFPDDPMLRFMNNTHTPAPYGYAWTALSILPYILGMNRFLITWLSFKAFSILALILSFFCLKKIIKKETALKLAPLFLNPLLLIEVIANGHNDLWMIWPIILSLALANSEKKNFTKLLAIISLVLFSVYIKYASLVAIPFLLFLLLKKQIKSMGIAKKLIDFFEKYFYDFLALAFFAPLFTPRSRQFLSWYLIWSLSFLPLLKSRYLKNLLLVFSVTALLSYLPWLKYLPWMSFDVVVPNLPLLKKYFIWPIPAIYSLIYLGNSLFNRGKKK